jgi:hypothetical protein
MHMTKKDRGGDTQTHRDTETDTQTAARETFQWRDKAKQRQIIEYNEVQEENDFVQEGGPKPFRFGEWPVSCVHCCEG